MKIEVITTSNEQLKETGFGGIKASQSVVKSFEGSEHLVNLSICKTRADLDSIIERQPDLVILGVKYLELENKKQLWLSEYFEQKQINYTGSTRSALEFDSNKVSAKLLLRNLGVVRLPPLLNH